MNEYKKSIALGTFDGFHLGHQKVIELSKKSGYMPYVLLFSVHPLKCIKGEAPPEILTDGLRKSLLGEMNVGALEIDFSEIMHLSPESFVRDILVGRFRQGQFPAVRITPSETTAPETLRCCADYAENTV